MDIQVFLAPIAAIGGVIAWLHEKNKRKASERLIQAQADNAELNTVEKAIAIWRNLAKEFQHEVQKLRETVEEFTLQNEKLRCEVEELKIENEKLRLEVRGLREELKLKNI